MKISFGLILGAMCMLLTSLVSAATYSFSTDPYTTFVPVIDNAFSAGMSISGSVVTSAPVPPGLSYEDISYLITSYSFNDGLHVFTESNSSIHPTITGGGFKVITDSSGNITDASVLIMSTLPPNVVGNPVNYFAFGDGYHAYDSMNCITSVTDGLCDGIEFVTDQSSRVVSPKLYVTSDQSAGAANMIPASPRWSLVLLASLTMIIGILMFRLRLKSG